MHDSDSKTPDTKADFLDPSLFTIKQDNGEAMYVTLVSIDATSEVLALVDPISSSRYVKSRPIVCVKPFTKKFINTQTRQIIHE